MQLQVIFNKWIVTSKVANAWVGMDMIPCSVLRYLQRSKEY